MRSELTDGMVVLRNFQNILQGLTKHGNWSDALELEHFGSLFL